MVLIEDKLQKTWHFRLYIAGSAAHSQEARANLEALCREYLPGCHIEIIDILDHPERGLADGVLATPALVRLSPQPVRRLIGTLSNRKQVLSVLGLMGGVDG